MPGREVMRNGHLHAVVLDLVVPVARELVGLDVHRVAVAVVGVHGREGDAGEATLQRNLVPRVVLDLDALHGGGSVGAIRDLDVRDGLHGEGVIEVFRRGDVLQRVVEEQAQANGGRALVAVVAHGVPEVEAVEVPPAGLHVLVERQGAGEHGVTRSIDRAEPHVENGADRAHEADLSTRCAVLGRIVAVQRDGQGELLVVRRVANDLDVRAHNLAGIGVVREEVEDLEGQFLRDHRHIAGTVHDPVSDEIVLGRCVS